MAPSKKGPSRMATTNSQRSAKRGFKLAGAGGHEYQSIMHFSAIAGWTTRFCVFLGWFGIGSFADAAKPIDWNRQFTTKVVQPGGNAQWSPDSTPATAVSTSRRSTGTSQSSFRQPGEELRAMPRSRADGQTAPVAVRGREWGITRQPDILRNSSAQRSWSPPATASKIQPATGRLWSEAPPGSVNPPVVTVESNAKTMDEAARQLSMQDINRYVYRAQHSSRPGIPVRRVGGGRR